MRARSIAATSPGSVTMPAPVAMMMPVMMPADFGGHLLRAEGRVFLDRGSCSGIAQRHRLRLLDWSCDGKKGADSGKAQNFRSVH